MTAEPVPTPTARVLSPSQRGHRSYDEATWRSFVTDFDRILRGYLLGRGVPAADAEDLAQEVYVKLLRALTSPDLDPRRGCFRGWLRRVAERTLADRRRADRRRRRLEAEWCRHARAVQRPREDDRRELLEQMLARVRARTAPNTWRCFEGRILEQRSAAEVAVECGLTVNAVRVSTSRVLARLRRLCRATAGSGGATL